MSTPIANLTISQNLFADSIDRINQLCFTFSTIAVTSAANSTGGSTSGNVAIVGIFNANTVAAGTLRGGTVAVAANLTVTSNTAFTGGNTSFTSNALFTGANTIVNSANFNVGANSAFAANVSIAGLTTFSANAAPNANGVSLGLTSKRWEVFANTVDGISMSANSVAANVHSVSGVGDILGAANTNLLTSGSAKVVLSFPIATYKSAKVSIGATALSGDYQMSDTMVLTNGVTASYTTSVLYSNTQFFTVDSVVNGPNVDVRITPSSANVSVKVLAQLIKG